MYQESLIGFEWLGPSHLAALGFLFIMVILIWLLKDKISVRLDGWIRKTLAVFLVFLEFNFYFWMLVIQRRPFDVSMLPLGLCAMSLYLTALMLWTKNIRLLKIILPWALSGALISIVIVNMAYDFPHFRYVHYFGNHIGFMLGNLYMVVIHRVTYSYKDLLKSSKILFIIALIMYPINFLIDANHLFLRELPEGTDTLYGYLGSFWVLGFAFSIFLLFHLWYIPIQRLSKWRQPMIE